MRVIRNAMFHDIHWQIINRLEAKKEDVERMAKHGDVRAYLWLEAFDVEKTIMRSLEPNHKDIMEKASQECKEVYADAKRLVSMMEIRLED